MCGGAPSYPAPAPPPPPAAPTAADQAIVASQATQQRLLQANAAGFGTNILTGGLGSGTGASSGGAKVLGATS